MSNLPSAGRDYSGPQKEKGASWGLMIPGRPYTPDPVKIPGNDEGSSQVPAMSYVRVADHGSVEAATQKLVQYYGGTSQLFGPHDKVFDFQPGDPFHDQYLEVDNAVRAVKEARRGHEDPADPFSRFRETDPNHVNSDHNRMLPSRLAPVYHTQSYYTQLNRAKETPYDVRLWQYEAQIRQMTAYYDHLRGYNDSGVSNTTSQNYTRLPGHPQGRSQERGGSGIGASHRAQHPQHNASQPRRRQGKKTKTQGLTADNEVRRGVDYMTPALAGQDYNLMLNVQPPTPAMMLPSRGSSASLREEFEDILNQGYLPPTGPGVLRGVLRGSAPTGSMTARSTRPLAEPSQTNFNAPPEQSFYTAGMQTVPTPVFNVNEYTQNTASEHSNRRPMLPIGTRPKPPPHLLSPFSYNPATHSNSSSSTNEGYDEYSVFGEQPGRVSRNPTPPGPGRRLYEQARSGMSSPGSRRPQTPPPRHGRSAA